MPIPVSTYRLQMHSCFNLRDATAVIPYLKSLGTSHVYMSSLLAAKPGSTHGYDVIDHTRLNPEIGTDQDLEQFVMVLHSHGMGLILDVVPNHMSVGGPNAWWRDVLENGQSSRYAGYFDIAWNDHHREPMRGKVLLPILGTPYGESIDTGAWRVEFEGGGFQLVLPEARLPIDPRTYGVLLEPALEAMKAAAGPEEALHEFRSVLAAIRHLPPRLEPDADARTAAQSEIVIIKRRLKDWAASDPAGFAILGQHLALFAADLTDLDKLVDQQAYRPCFWRVATDEINYRRFFDVNDLAALATERPEVFDDVHRLILDWVKRGLVDGLRIDHPDGLYDPKAYLERLQEGRSPDDPLYVVVEKILAPREALRGDWATAGTTGYDFLTAVNGLFVAPEAEKPLTRFHEEFTGEARAFHDIVYRSKFLILQSSLTSELHVLAGHFDRLAQAERGTRDLTLNGLRHGLRELLACFPRYRTYVTDRVDDEDRVVILKAVRHARRRNPLLGRALFDFLGDTLLLLPPPGGMTPEYETAQRRCAGKFQQLAAPVMAKGVEDTAFYRFNRFVSLNEVGGSPAVWGTSPTDLHAFLQGRPRGSLSATATHDTKRGEDVRARLNAITRDPAEWIRRVTLWAAANEKHKGRIDDHHVPDRSEEYLLYQTLVGTWPGGAVTAEYVQRIQDYMTKAVQEAKVYSSWINPDADYVDAVRTFVATVLNAETAGEFLRDLDEHVRQLQPAALVTSLSQTLLRCTAPGVPDAYQGTEFEDLHLVDPDNRGRVDYTVRRAALAQSDLMSAGGSPTKLLVLSRALRLRQRWAVLFAEGDYIPLWPADGARDAVFAFLRTHEGAACLVAVPCRAGFDPVNLKLSLPETWHGRTWRCIFNNHRFTDIDGQLSGLDLLGDYPVCCAMAPSDAAHHADLP